MKITIFGASGYTGQKVLQMALAKGYFITAFTRDSKAIQLQHANLKIVQGNVLQLLDVENAITNSDVVIQCLGIGGKGYGKPTYFISEATKVIVQAMANKNVNRLIAMSNVGAGNSISFMPKIFTKLILPYFMKWLKVIIDDKNRMEPIIMNSNLAWTIIRFPNIVETPSKNKITVTLDGKQLKMSITNTEAATFIVNQIESNSFINQAPSVSN